MDEQNQQPTPPSKSNTPWVIAAIVIILIIAGVAYAEMHKSKTASTTGDQTGEESMTTDNSGSMGDSAASSTENTTTTTTPATMNEATTTPIQKPTQQAVKTFDVAASNFTFSIKEIKVNKGDKVKINLTNSGGMHDWVIDEFNAHSPRIGAGETATIEFTADKTGTFEYYCSVGTHRQMGMKGNLIVQ